MRPGLFPIFLIGGFCDEHYALLPSSLRRIIAVAENTLNYLLLTPHFLPRPNTQ